ncbi:unnamed protein product [Urochloa decumbens]|uniref:DUF1618 domain-containing protein n=1 Tax=Urochloa decumbens TaxID=240449 RepID=A0ABC9DW24_9POAL
MATLAPKLSFYPPSLPDVGGSYPNRVLLSVRGYIVDRANETTATSSTSKGQRIQVCFFAATPPTLSHLCVYCSDSAFTSGPCVIASHGNLILLSTATRSTSDPFGEEIYYDYFVYSADDTGATSLDRLPDPGHIINRDNVGLVASGSRGDGYAVVTLNPDPSCKRYIVRVYHEKTGRWRRKIVSRKMLPTESAGGKGLEDEILPFTSTKVITLQGSNIAWVDLRGAVLLCDVLDKDPVAYYIPLPKPLNDKNKGFLESPSDPCFFRDTIGRQNAIKFVEMDYRYGGDYALLGWKAVTFSWTIGSKNCCTGSVVDLEDVLENSESMLSLLCLGKGKVESKNITPMCAPTLCDRDNTLYLISKPKRRFLTGSAVAVDTSEKALRSVIPMSDERVLGFSLTFLHCTFSKCFNDVGDGSKIEDQTSNEFLDLSIGR